MPLRSPRCTAARAWSTPVAADAEQADEIGMGAEAAVPHADPELRAQPGRHQGVVHPLERERRHGQPGPLARTRADGPSTRTPSMDREPVVQPRRQRALVRRDRLPTDPLQLVHGRPEGHRADHVRRTGLLALGRIGPDDLVQVDQVDRAAAGEERIALLEDLAAGR